MNPEAAGFEDAEKAVLRALPVLMGTEAASALESLRAHFDLAGDRGEVGQIVHAYGLYRGMHFTLAALGAEIIGESGKPLSANPGFHVVTDKNGQMRARKAFDAK